MNDYLVSCIEETEEHCRRENVTIIVISNIMWKDWPIHKIFQGAELPPNWKLIKVIEFKEDKIKGYPAESYFVFRRS